MKAVQGADALQGAVTFKETAARYSVESDPATGVICNVGQSCGVSAPGRRHSIFAPDAKPDLATGDACREAEQAVNEFMSRMPTSLNAKFIVEEVYREVTVTRDGAPQLYRSDVWGRAVCIAGVEDQSGKASIWWGPSGSEDPYHPFSHRLRSADLAQLAESAQVDASHLASGIPTPTGVQAVVFTAQAAATVTHELLGHLLEGDNARNPQRARSVGPGTYLGNDDLSFIHDGITPRFGIGGPFDDEGTPTSMRTLIDYGTVVGLLDTRDTAIQHGATPEGHARRASYVEPALPWMASIVVRAGDRPVGELLERDCVLITGLTHAAMDPRTGTARLHVRSGAILSGGKQTAVTVGGTVMVDIFDALAAIDGIGDDPASFPALCFKRGQRMVTSAASPTLRFKTLRIN